MVGEICTASVQILLSLKKGLNSTDFDQRINTFETMSLSFKEYIPNLQNYKDSKELIAKELKKNTQFASFIKTSMRELLQVGCSPVLNDYLMLPIQRMLRYKMICRDLQIAAPKLYSAQLDDIFERIVDVLKTFQ
jgi:hypothetical protein